MLNILEENKTLEKIHRLFLDNGITFVSYRLPFHEKVTTMLQWQSEPAVIKDIRSLKNKSGFVFAPFFNNSKNPIRLIAPDLILTGDEPEEYFKPDTYVEDALKEFPKSNVRWDEKHQTSNLEYTTQVSKIKEMIGEGKLSKVVLSRISVDNKPDNFNPSELFNALHLAYPEAFVYLLFIPGAGMWCGASPEPLLHVSGDTATTVSLAGTRKFSENYNGLEWDHKELNEQEVVTTYIDTVLEKFEIKDYIRNGPHTYRAGNIEHLRSVFSFRLDELNDRIFEFIDELHPTPSVCGLPKNRALDYIRQTEFHDREYYSGFLGPLNIHDEWSLYVNLRCLKVGRDKLAYYLGAGITEGSDPGKEWDETESKKNTLQSIIKKITAS
jgi:isochorismate synthase